ncbi:MAG: hypothetical protein O2860_12225, partial [Chloroflexi bacterium]|nr:hypothetical protein [Chloroflexota bacterium]
ALPVALAAGVLPDLDHVIDYLDSRDDGWKRHMFRPFHAWEYLLLASIVALAFYSNQLFLVAIFGYLSHIAIDQLANRAHPLAYTLTYRIMKGFRRRELTPHLFEPRYRMARQPMPFWARLEPTLWKLVVAVRNKRQ